MSTGGCRFLRFLPLLALALSGCAYDAECVTADCKLAADVLAHLNQDNSLKTDHLRVSSQDHVVYLDGIVDTQREYFSAEEIARQVPLVERVVNNIGVMNVR
jgi:osmotically-inducible protein OsmY